MIPFRRFRERRRRESLAHALYSSIIVQSRLPEFFHTLAVPDTLDGRFDLVVLHAFLVMHRLKQAGRRGDETEARELSQTLFDMMFADMDQNLREMGVGDMSIGKKIKQMARAFYGRVSAYEDGLAAGDEALAAALLRNLYGTLETPVDTRIAMAVAAYLRYQAATLEKQEDEAVLGGRVSFASLEEASHAP